VTDDRQTDHATEKRVAIGRIACTKKQLQMPTIKDNTATFY